MELDVFSVQSEIQKRIDWLDKGMKVLTDTGQALAIAEAEYERDLAIANLQIQNGVMTHIEKEPIKKVLASNVRDLAKGAIKESKLNLGLAEAAHKAAKIKLDIISAQLNAWQSIFRHLEQTVRQ